MLQSTIYTPVDRAEVDLVTLAEAKKQLYTTGTAQDTVIQRAIATALVILEAENNIIATDSTWQMKLEAWPQQGNYYYHNPYYGRIWCEKAHIYIIKTPIRSIESIKYIDAAGDEQTLVEDTDYVYELAAKPPVVRMLNMPGLNADVIYPITINFTAGWEATEDIPANIRTAAMQLITNLYELRQEDVIGVTVSSQTSTSVARLIQSSKILVAF